MKHVLLVDDHQVITMGLRSLLLTEFSDLHIEVAGDEASARKAVEVGHWDLAVIDINLPGRSGLDLMGTLKIQRPFLKVLIYTMYAEEHFGLRAIRAGADGYISKDAPLDSLFEAIRQVLQGQKYLSSSLANQLALSVENEKWGDKHQQLSNREFEVFQRIANGHSLSAIAVDLDINVKTVSTYRVRVLEKLQITNNAALVRYAIRQHLIE